MKTVLVVEIEHEPITDFAEYAQGHRVQDLVYMALSAQSAYPGYLSPSYDMRINGSGIKVYEYKKEN